MKHQEGGKEGNQKHLIFQVHYNDSSILMIDNKYLSKKSQSAMIYQVNFMVQSTIIKISKHSHWMEAGGNKNNKIFVKL